MDKSEILVEFRQAKDKKQQIKVLADLNCVAPRKIAELIDEAGELQAAGLSVASFSSRYVKVAGAKVPSGMKKKRGRPTRAPEPPYELPVPPAPSKMEASDGPSELPPPGQEHSLTVSGFLALLGKLLAPVPDAELSLNGERVLDIFGYEVTSRGKQIFVDVRTREG